MFDTYTLLKEDARIPFVRGIFIDVFPLDGVGNDLMKAKKKCKKIKKIIYLRNARTNRINKKSKTYRIITKWIIQHIPSFIINEKRLAIRIDNECKEYDFDSSEYLANLMGAWNEKEIIPKSVMGIPQLLPFENTSIYCPLKIDEYLRQIYGDWRTPPPKDKRKSTHHCVFDMTKPYLDINNN